MKKYSTPGVYTEEIDQSNTTSPAGTSTLAMVIRSTKGPINRPVLVTSEQDIIDNFGTPVFTSGANSNVTTPSDSATKALIPDLGYGLYGALQFVNESSAIYLARVVDNGGNDKYAGRYLKLAGYDFATSATFTSATSASAVGIETIAFNGQFDTPDNISSIETSGFVDINNSAILSAYGLDFLVSSLSPGTDGNNIAVSIENYSSGCDWRYNYDDYTSAAPTVASKVFRLDVYLKGSAQSWATIKSNLSVSGNSGIDLRSLYSPVETFYGTVGDQLDVNKNQLNIKTVVNGNSKYIYVKTTGSTQVSSTNGTNYTILTTNHLFDLSGGSVSTSGTGLGTDVVNTWSIFASKELIAGINILLAPDWNTTVKQTVATIAANRKDCIAVVQDGDPSKTTPADLLAAEAYGYSVPSYVAVYAGYDKVYDQYNGKFVFLPKAIFGAVLMARTDNIANTWDAPAGLARGIIPSVSQKFVLTSSQIGQLYDRNINTSLGVVGTGSVMWGQKTAQMKHTALDRINVRRLLLYIENSLIPMLQSFLFELNNDKTRQRITSQVSSFLGDIQAGGGLEGYQTICDSSNNTPTVIDNNQLIVDIGVQPSRVAEFITLRTTITNSGVTVTEI